MQTPPIGELLEKMSAAYSFSARENYRENGRGVLDLPIDGGNPFYRSECGVRSLKDTFADEDAETIDRLADAIGSYRPRREFLIMLSFCDHAFFLCVPFRD